MGNNSISAAMAAASQGMHAQSTRMRVVSENISNADTHGYKRKMISFQNALDRETGRSRLAVDSISLDQSTGEMEFNPAHPLANEQGYVAKSNVDLMIEMADAREASRSYEANLTTFQQARSMYSGLLDLMRR
ncbi:MAG: flagellar basal body rod protein FlgC [Robiginitomaculum sp.]|nr:MAG: flagellar basal body rod protein FlgC [Robiginitomaculum sp.]